MEEILKWLSNYSPGIVLLLALGAGFLFVLRKVVETTVDSSISLRTTRFEEALKRRSTFEEKVLSDRFTLIAAFSSKLEKAMTNLNRMRCGKSVPDGFKENNEIISLTEIFEDLEIHRLLLGEIFYELFQKQAQLALKFANTSDNAAWGAVIEDYRQVQNAIREKVDNDFGVSKIKWKT